MSTLTTTTSNSRPTAPSAGDTYFETDTKNIIIWDGSSWRGYKNDGISIPGVPNTFSGSFDGTDDYIAIGNLTNLNSATNYTISVWFKRPLARQDMLLGGKGLNGIAMYPWNDGKLYVHAGSTNTVYASLPGENQWINAVVTRDSTTTRLYFNGSVSAAGSSVTIPSTAGNSFRIGSLPDYSQHFLGNIDEVAIWDSTALDSDNVNAIYNAGSPINLLSNAGSYDQSSNLTHWYRFGDHSSDTGSGGSPSNGDTITNVENAANPGTNDGSTINGTPSFSTTVPSE